MSIHFDYKRETRKSIWAGIAGVLLLIMVLVLSVWKLTTGYRAPTKAGIVDMKPWQDNCQDFLTTLYL